LKAWVENCACLQASGRWQAAGHFKLKSLAAIFEKNCGADVSLFSNSKSETPTKKTAGRILAFLANKSSFLKSWQKLKRNLHFTLTSGKMVRIFQKLNPPRPKGRGFLKFNSLFIA